MEAGGITWLYHPSNQYEFDEVHLHGNAHVAILSNTSHESVLVSGGELYGDRSAVLHIGVNQSVDFDFVDVYFAANVLLYRYGELTVPPRLSLREVWMDIKGRFNGVDEFTVDSQGQLTLWSVGHSDGQREGVYDAVNVTVRAGGEMKLLAVEEDDDITFQTGLLTIHAGGVVETNRLILNAQFVTIDASGTFHADSRGYPTGNGPGAGLSASAYPGLRGASGAGHGGRGGRSHHGIYSSVAYGSTHWPREMGSGGGVGGTGGRGGGTMMLHVNDTLRVEGRLHANGEDGQAGSGGGAGGSLLLDVFHLDGSGSIEARGGDGDSDRSGGGSGGRAAIYYQHTSFSGSYILWGGDGAEQNAAAGTLYLQQNSSEGMPVYRHLVADNGQGDAQSSSIVEEESLSMAGPSSGSGRSYSTYSGAQVTTTATPWCSIFNGYCRRYESLSNIFNSVSAAYIAPASSAVTITVSLPFAVFVRALKVTPVCSGNGMGTQFNIRYSFGSQSVEVTEGFVQTVGCVGSPHATYNINGYVEQIEMSLLPSGGYVGMRYLEIVAREEPESSNQMPFATLPETLVVTGDERESVFEYEKVTVNGQAKLRFTSNSTQVTIQESLTGDHTGQFSVCSGQTLDILASRMFLAVSLLANPNSAITLSKVLECRRVGMKLYGELHDMDRMTIGSQCSVSLENPGHTHTAIDRLDIKTRGSLDINDESQGLTAINGSTLDVRSGGLVRCGDLKLHFDRVSVEPSATIQAGFSPEYRHKSEGANGNGLSGSTGSSGAGHGSNGGQGSSQPIAGVSYGSFLTPSTFGSMGGSSIFPHRGGSLGGRLYLGVSDTLHVDGTISAAGGVGDSPHAGGGSAGSIWLETETLNGDGLIDVEGGAGADTGGGGGAGGRVAVYYTYNHYSGSFVGAGGDSQFEPGGPGTIYLHKLQPLNASTLLDATLPEAQITHDSNVTAPRTNRTLYLNNLGRLPRASHRNLTEFYSAYERATTVTWLEPGHVADIARCLCNESSDYEADFVIDELHIYGGAELAFIDPARPSEGLHMRLGTIAGDRSGRMLIGFNQTMFVAQPDFPLSVDVYRGGDITLNGELIVSGVTFNIEGVLPLAENITIRDGGVLNMHEMVGLDGEATEEVEFNAISIRNHGTLLSHNGDQRRTLSGKFLQVYGGGELRSRNLHLEVERAIVDSYGSISVNGGGYDAGEGLGRAYDSTGASHGGEGGGQHSSDIVPPAYGSFTLPGMFGSGGREGSGASGGGILSVSVGDELRVEGRISADGSDSPSAEGGGASGGSILIQAETIHGTGVISANGGAGQGGGGGGRMALYYQYLSEGIAHRVEGGACTSSSGSTCEHGASGTVYLKQEGDAERRVLKSYNDFPTASSQTRRTVIPLPPGSNPDHDLDLLDIGQYAHVEVEAVDIGGEPEPDAWQRSLRVSNVAGDFRGTLHVGENDTVWIGENSTSRIPFSVAVYQNGTAHLPPISLFQEVDLTLLGGSVEGVATLEIGKNALLTFDPMACVNAEAASEMYLDSLLVLGGGALEFTGSVSANQELHMTLDGKLLVRGGGVMRANKLSVTAGDIEIDQDATVDVSGRGWPAGLGPGLGIFGLLGGSGASHGGRGGRGAGTRVQ
ncbi:uncharacterized protein [Diadema antillarum]|uniref:uncharacterized protein n=1 Tax=Diadema antillarum TaxID=105358 RepID=UPI003A849812